MARCGRCGTPVRKGPCPRCLERSLACPRCRAIVFRGERPGLYDCIVCSRQWQLAGGELVLVRQEPLPYRAHGPSKGGIPL